MGPLPSELHPQAERWLRVGALFAVNFVGYYLIGLGTDPSRGARLHTFLDDLLPFTSQAQWLYVTVYTAMLYPAFVVRDRGLFRQVTRAYLVVIAIQLLFFALFPVTAEGLRPDPATLPLDTFHGWGLRLNYHLDPPTNLFPSLHLSIATLAALSGWTARRAFGLCAAPIVAGIALSICLVKQHYAVDGLAGLALGAATWAAIVRRCPEAELPVEERATGWTGPLACLALTVSGYTVMFALFMAGWRPWEG